MFQLASKPADSRFCAASPRNVSQVVEFHLLTHHATHAIGSQSSTPASFFLGDRSFPQLPAPIPFQIYECNQTGSHIAIDLEKLAKLILVQSERTLQLFEHQLNLPSHVITLHYVTSRSIGLVGHQYLFNFHGLVRYWFFIRRENELHATYVVYISSFPVHVKRAALFSRLVTTECYSVLSRIATLTGYEPDGNQIGRSKVSNERRNFRSWRWTGQDAFGIDGCNPVIAAFATYAADRFCFKSCVPKDSQASFGRQRQLANHFDRQRGLCPIRHAVITAVFFREITLKERNAATARCNQQAHHKAVTGAASRFLLMAIGMLSPRTVIPTAKSVLCFWPLVPNISLIRNEKPRAAAPEFRANDPTFQSIQHRSVNRESPSQIPAHIGSMTTGAPNGLASLRSRHPATMRNESGYQPNQHGNLRVTAKRPNKRLDSRQRFRNDHDRDSLMRVIPTGLTSSSNYGNLRQGVSSV